MGQSEHTLYYCSHVSAALSLGQSGLRLLVTTQSGLRLCSYYTVWAQTV